MTAGPVGAARPTDASARARVAGDTAATLFVDAGAGTGKTASLVARVLTLVVRDGVPLRSIAAITFTVAAAAELRDRIRDSFDGLLAGRAEPPPGVVVDAVGRDRCEAALHQLDEAAITTLHGFAQRILAEFPLEAGLPPAIEVVDDVAADIDFERRWTAFLDALFDDPEMAHPLAEAVALGLWTRQLRDIAVAFHQHWDHVRAADLTAPRIPAPDLAPVRAALAAVIERLPDCADAADALARHIEDTVVPLAADLDELGDSIEALELLGRDVALRCNHGRGDAWPDVAAVREATAVADATVAALLAERRSLALAALLPRLRDFTLDGAAARAGEGRLEFHDLLVRARDLLVADVAVRARLAHRYARLLVDEFQDTDPLQVEIATLLAAAEPSAHVDDWQQVVVAPGRLFLVGDPKQSIYRFRRADIAVYEAARVVSAADEVGLTVNFRSRPGVLRWVNHVFGELMGEGEPGAQPPYRPVHPHRGGGDQPAHDVTVVGGPVAGRVDEVRRQEAAALVDLIATAKDDGWPVEDRHGGPTRRARYDDIAVLVPARTTLPELEDALTRAGIPFRMESRSLLFRTDEVRTLLAILQAVDDPGDEVAVVAALRSPALACRDDELVAFRLAGGRWDYTATRADDVPEDDPVSVAMDRLRLLHERRWWTTVAGMVDLVVRELRLVELATAERRPRDAWRRVRYLLDQARAFTEAGGRTLREFVRWAGQQAESDAAVVETPVAEPDDDAVRILTVHGAKGLEFPVTILAGLNVQPPPRGPVVLWRPREGRVGVSVGARHRRFATPGFEELAAEERHLDEHERVRLLYVAATRARDHLVVSVFHQPGNGAANTAAGRLHALCEAAPELWRPWPPWPHDPQPNVRRNEPAGGSIPPHIRRPPPETVPDRAAWLAQREAAVAAASRPSAVAATRLAAAAAPPRVPPHRPGVVRSGPAGAAVGRAVHAVLQAVDLRTGQGIDAMAEACAVAEGVPAHAERVGALARAALEAPVVREAAASGRSWREVYVAAPIDGTTVEGFVDLLFDDGDGLVVVDYKTDAVADAAAADAAVSRYRLQAAAYAAVLGQALGRPVHRCVFVFLSEGGAVERPLPDVAADVAAVRESVEAVVGAGARPV